MTVHYINIGTPSLEYCSTAVVQEAKKLIILFVKGSKAKRSSPTSPTPSGSAYLSGLIHEPMSFGRCGTVASRVPGEADPSVKEATAGGAM